MRDQNATHVIFDVIFKQFPAKLEDVDFWKKTGKEALDKGKFIVLGELMHKFEPMGISGVWLLSESHLSFHTWPEEKRVFIDLFSCGDKERTKKTIDSLIDSFKEQGGKIEERKDIKRGYTFDDEEKSFSKEKL